MTMCSACGHQNSQTAKMCGQCGTPLMSAGVGYGGPESSPPFPGGGGNVLPTVPEGMPGGGAGGLGNVRVGGAEPTIMEGVGGAPAAFGAGASRGGGFPAAGGPKTRMPDEVGKPVAGWLVVLRSRSLSPYQDIPLFKGRNLLGRAAPEPVQCIADGNASNQHALVLSENGTSTITDLGSANGTIVNNERIQATALAKGDRVKIGKTTFVFVPVPAPKDGRVGAW